MPDPTPHQAQQLPLLQRLIEDNPPGQTVDPQGSRIMDQETLRTVVRQDLERLFNTVQLEATDDLSNVPEVRTSVLNYGIPEIAGLSLADLDPIRMERLLRNAILAFEPRIEPKSLRCRLVKASQEMSSGALTFFIEAEIRADPQPLALYLRSELDMEQRDICFEQLSSPGG